MINPSIFISYSHDNEDHKSWVRKLASDLRLNGINVTLDQWDLALGQDIGSFMQKGISKANRVLLICSSGFVKKANMGKGGVGYEKLIVTAEVIKKIDTKKFIPVIRNNLSKQKIPLFLGARLYIDFTNDSKYNNSLDELIREIIGVPKNTKPPLGEIALLKKNNTTQNSQYSLNNDASSITIEINEINSNSNISGIVHGLNADEVNLYKVLVYVYTDVWYIHPYAGYSEGVSWARIAPSGKWEIKTVKRASSSEKVAALVVAIDCLEPNTVADINQIPNLTFFVKQLIGTSDMGKL